jgi:outer membrane protein assembly factor BamB
MRDFRHSPDDDDAVEMIDLDPRPQSRESSQTSAYHHIFHIALAWLRLKRVRFALFTLASLVSLLIFILVLDLPLPTLFFTKQEAAPATPAPLYDSVLLPHSYAFTQIAAANGIVYLSRLDGTLSARQAISGRLLWSRQLPYASYARLQAENQTLYILFHTHTASIIEARRGSDGTLLWIYRLPMWGPHSLMMSDGIVYFNTYDGVVYALRANDGTMLWHYAAERTGPVSTFLWLTGGTASIQTPDLTVHVLRASDGTQIMSYQSVNAPATWWPYVEGDTIYLQNEQHAIQARSLSTGKLLWQHSPIGDEPQLWTVQDNQVYLNYENIDGSSSMMVLRGQNGTVLWRYRTATAIIGSPLIQNGVVYLVVEGNTVLALRTSDGSVLWQQPISGFQFGPLAINNILCFGQANSIEALGSDGMPLWMYSAHANVIWHPQKVDNLLLLPLTDGTVDVIRTSDGSLLWSYPAS